MLKQNNIYTVFMVLLCFTVSFCFKKLSSRQETGLVKKHKPLQGIRVAWDYSSRLKLAPQPGRRVAYCGYPRMIQLYNKILLCVYEVSGGNVESIRSADKGITWSAPVVIATRQNGINMAVPDVLELHDHSLLVSYNPRPVQNNSSGHFGIRTKKSYDGGLTWTDERLLYEAGSKFEDGCWEPSQIQLPSGEVQLFFSNEGVYTSSNEQNISLFRSLDNGLTWTTQPQIVSFRAGKRDGMPVPVLLKGKNEILFSIEDNGAGEFKPAIIRTSMANNWNTITDGTSPNRNGAMAETLPDSIYAGAPFLRQLQTGETILSYQGTEGRTRQWDKACMKVVVGNENGKNFGNTTIPFNVPITKSGLWNSLCVLDDSTVAALTCTNAYAENATEVWMIKGHIIPAIIIANQQNVVTDAYLTEKVWATPFPVFIGHTSSTSLRAAAAWNDDCLFVAVRVRDQHVITDSLDPANNDNITIYLNTKNISVEMPVKEMYAITVSADNSISIKVGDNNNWKEITTSLTTMHAVNKEAGGYVVETGIPWALLGGKPALNKRIGFNISLFDNSGAALPAYTETIANSLIMNPNTWCTLELQ